MARRARLGQHFLDDPAFIERAVEAIRPQPGERIVEIGPGRGALSGPLLARCGRLDVIELDRGLAQALAPRPGLRVHVGDALAWPFARLADEDGDADGVGRLRIAGNLPYYLSTPLLFRLFAQIDCIADMHFMLQREVAERLTAPPGVPAYGRLGVMARCHAEAQVLFEVPPEAFRPPPRVWSAFVRLTPLRPPPVEDVEGLGRLVTRAFSHRRKRLGNALRGLLDEEAIRACGIDPGRRPATLGLEEFAALADAARRAVSSPAATPPAAPR